jgi:hypothetical protein
MLLHYQLKKIAEEKAVAEQVSKPEPQPQNTAPKKPAKKKGE